MYKSLIKTNFNNISVYRFVKKLTLSPKDYANVWTNHFYKLLTLYAHKGTD